MKSRFCHLLLIIVTLFFCGCRPKIKIIDTQLKYCEAVYPIGDTLLITNFGSDLLNPLTRSDSTGYIMGDTTGKTFSPLSPVTVKYPHLKAWHIAAIIFMWLTYAVFMSLT